MSLTLTPTRAPLTATPAQAKAWKTAQEFEAQFLKSMLEQAFAGVEGDGPMGKSGPGAEVWRSMLIDQHAGAMARQGGIGIAPYVYRDLARRNGGLNATL